MNVYRLIVEKTLEEQIMSLQRFKENLAKSLVQSRGVGTEEAASLEMSDILKSFEEHSAFGQELRKKEPLVHDKIINGIEDIWKGENLEDL